MGTAWGAGRAPRGPRRSRGAAARRRGASPPFPSKTTPGPARRICGSGPADHPPLSSWRKKSRPDPGGVGTVPAGRDGAAVAPGGGREKAVANLPAARRARSAAHSSLSVWGVLAPLPSPRGESGQGLPTVMVRTSQWGAAARPPPPMSGGRRWCQRGRLHRPPLASSRRCERDHFAGGIGERRRARRRSGDRGRGTPRGPGRGAGVSRGGARGRRRRRLSGERGGSGGAA